MQTQESRQLLGLDGELARRLIETRAVARAAESANWPNENYASALGQYGVYLIQYADEINAALDADDELSAITLDVEPTVEMLEHAHELYEALPDQAQLGISCSMWSWECDGSFPLRDVREALMALEAAGKLARAERLAAFMLIVNTVPAYGVHEFGEYVGVDASSLRDETAEGAD